jgi:hypothetical protein
MLKILFFLSIFILLPTTTLASSPSTNEVAPSDLDDFYNKYQSQNIHIDNEFEYEYICSEPINTSDCRSYKNVDILKPPFSGHFKITNLLYKYKIPFFEILIDEQQYYILAKRIMNGINATNFHTSEKEEIVTIGSTYNLNGTFFICNSKIKKISCDVEHELISDFSFEIIDSVQIKTRKTYKVLINETDKKHYWIDDYIISMFATKNN